MRTFDFMLAAVGLAVMALVVAFAASQDNTPLDELRKPRTALEILKNPPRVSSTTPPYTCEGGYCQPLPTSTPLTGWQYYNPAITGTPLCSKTSTGTICVVTQGGVAK